MRAMTSFGERIFGALSIDRAVFFAVIGKVWSVPAGTLTSLLVILYFSPAMQGYYYTFSSVLTMQVFAELGLGVIITYYSSHEWAHLAFDEHGHIVGKAEALSRLSSLAQFAIKWYLVGGIVLTGGFAMGGLLFFSQDTGAHLGWKQPWLVLSISSGLTFCAVPFLALMDGCGMISSAYIYRLLQNVLSSVAVWLAIFFGAGLWAATINNIAALSVLIVLIGSRNRRFFQDLFFARISGPRLDWQENILPMQWRLALSAASSYFVFSLFTPVLFHFHGPAIAGQMGVTWAYIGALSMVATSWVAPKAPTFGILIAQRKFSELDRLLWRTTLVVLGVTIIGALVIWGGTYSLYFFHSRFATRLLPPTPTVYFLLGTIVSSLTIPLSTYLRAHKEEPLMPLSIISAVLMAVTVIILGKYYSVEGIGIGYLFVMLLTAPCVVYIWDRRRRANILFSIAMNS